MDRLDNVGGTDPADARGGTEQLQRVLHDVKSKSRHEFDRQRLPRAVSHKTKRRDELVSLA